MSSALSLPASAATAVKPERVNLFGLDREALRAQFRQWGEAPFRAEQLMQWVYGRGVTDFSQMTTLAKPLRERLAELAVIATPTLVTAETSTDGTRKWLLSLNGGAAVETVFIPEKDRGTLCVSSQVGCAMDCSFCATGHQGFARNMSVAEIIGQVWFARHALVGEQLRHAHAMQQRAISNVVFMGMGEPLANFDALIPAINILLDDYGFGLSKRRVTVSTSGLVPFMDRLKNSVDVALAVSLHAPSDALRNELVPINRKYPLAALMAACDRYTEDRAKRVHVLYEYVLIDQVNDGNEQADQLIALLRGRAAKVNLIPFNPFPGNAYRRPSNNRLNHFQQRLLAGGLKVTLRRTRGDDIAAACGQLVGEVKSRQRQSLRGVPLRIENQTGHRDA